jgi:sec-independent protein translocase protein TatA
MFGRISTWELIIIVVILLLFFGARRLPDIARSLGEAAREFRKSVRKNDEEVPPGDTDEH